MTLKEIALELLHLYKNAEMVCIYECSGNIKKEIEELAAEVKAYERMIKECSNE